MLYPSCMRRRFCLNHLDLPRASQRRERYVQRQQRYVTHLPEHVIGCALSRAAQTSLRPSCLLRYSCLHHTNALGMDLLVVTGTASLSSGFRPLTDAPPSPCRFPHQSQITNQQSRHCRRGTISSESARATCSARIPSHGRRCSRNRRVGWRSWASTRTSLC